MLKTLNDLPIIKVPAFNKGSMRKLKRSIIVENVLHKKKLIRHAASRAPTKNAATMTNLVQKRHIQEFPPVSYDLAAPEDHFIVLPEEINELPSNEILRIPKKGEPEIDFSKLPVEAVFKGVSKVVSAFENFCIDYNNGIEGKKDSLVELFKLIEENMYPAECAHNILMIVATADPSNYRHPEIYQLMERYQKARSLRTQDEFQKSFESFVMRDREKLTDTEKKMLYFYNFPKPDRNLRTIDHATLSIERSNLWSNLTRFRQNLYVTNESFTHTVDDPDVLSKISNDLDNFSDLHHKERTPFQVTISTYKRFMQVCPDRFVRQMLWQTYHKRCSPKASARFNNLPLISAIRVHRRRIADTNGYRTHADYRRAHSIAKSRNEILDNLKQLNERNQPKLVEHLQELNDYASDNNFYDPSQIGIQEYDLEYWAQRYIHEIIIGVSERDLKALFPLQSVIQGMQKFFEENYNIKFKTVKRSKDGLIKGEWHAALQYFEVNEGDKPLGTIIFDPYRREGKPLSEMLYARVRSRHQDIDCLPCRFIGASYQLDQAKKQAHLGITEILDTFRCFATVIQRLLYNYEFYELNNHGALEVDAKDLFPNLCLAQLLNDHKVLQSCSSRGDGKKIDAELASRILKAIAFTRPLRTWHDLYKAHLDTEVNTKLEDVKKVAEDVYSLYSPFSRDPDYYDYCAMESVFIGPNDAIQYAGLWSKQLANFCLQQAPSESGPRKDYYTNLRKSLFSPDNFDTIEKLSSLTGGSFKASESSLGML